VKRNTELRQKLRIIISERVQPAAMEIMCSDNAHKIPEDYAADAWFSGACSRDQQDSGSDTHNVFIHIRVSDTVQRHSGALTKPGKALLLLENLSENIAFFRGQSLF
jgi:hypothetical protein